MSGNVIGLEDTIHSAVMKMCEGNPGAATVIGQLLQRSPDLGIIRLMHLDDLGIRGPQIWVAYKDHCDSDIARLEARIDEHDASLGIERQPRGARS